MVEVDQNLIQEWLDALADVVEYEGAEQAESLLARINQQAQQMGVKTPAALTTPYKNTIPLEAEVPVPGDAGMEKKIRGLIRWNAVAMVVRAVKKAAELGGHIATYASAAVLYEVGFNHFFHARSADHPGDLLYIQGHSSPGLYARSFLEGRFSEDQLEHFRQEIDGNGLSSYPHAWLMPDYWQFATVSMGLGAIQAIYQARFLKYMEARSLIDNKDRKVWVFCGDGEMDEPESLGALNRAARDECDNLIFVINCNLQRLDGPVYGNGKIIQELEGLFKGAGWNVIKVLWGGRWDALFAKDTSGLLLKRMEECVDGDFQNYRSRDGAYIREHFFGKYPELLELVADMSDDDIWKLNRGGHDPKKVYNAYKQAVEHKGQPTVILAKTVKGFGLGGAGESANVAHNLKKMSTEELQGFCDHFDIPIPKDKVAEVPFYRPDVNSPEIKYLQQRREALGGYLPARHHEAPKLKVPSLDAFASQLEGSGEREVSTTMAFVRVLSQLLKDKELGKYIVPISADESRTFGMEGLFRQVGIYSHLGQLYNPQDREQLMYYKESKTGQLLEEGITEAGSMCSWIAAATSYSSNGVPMIPFYIYYSQFGFQRVGDLVWAAGDMCARGFLLGATAGRTTLAGEGLQHQDGSSHLLFGTVPNAVCYDPAYAYELTVIMQDGLRRMVAEQENVFYYITMMNENYVQPAMPKGVEEGILKGMYRLSETKGDNKLQLLGSGAILNEVIAAAELLEKDFNVHADVWSVTSFNELRRDAMETERYNRLHPGEKAKQSYVSRCFSDVDGPVLAATDYMRLHAEQIRADIPGSYVVLGTDGFGRSDTRKALRAFFEVDRYWIAYTSLHALVDAGTLSADVLTQAMKKYEINQEKVFPVNC